MGVFHPKYGLHVKFLVLTSNGSVGRVLTARLTTPYCVPPRWKKITFMQNCLVHHLVSTRLHCAPPKCMPIQNNFSQTHVPLVHHGAQCRLLYTQQLLMWIRRRVLHAHTSHGHRSPLCTIVMHNAGQWCTT